MKVRGKINSVLIWVTFIFGLNGGPLVHAQDFHLSQYEAFPIYFNPAMTGLFEGDQRVSVHYRDQWRRVATRPFVSGAFSFDMPLKKVKNFSIGGFILNNTAGAGNYNNLNALISTGYDIKFKNPDHRLSIGAQGGIIHKSLNVGKLLFGEQFALVEGGAIADPSLGNGENYSNQSIFMPSVNTGLIYFYSNDASKFNPFIGVSSFNLTEPNESFFGATNKLPRRYLIHGGTKYNISPKFQMAANVMGMLQTNAKELTVSVLGYYYFKDSDTYLMFGNTFRSQDVVMAHFGMKYKDFAYRLSYDLNTSSLAPITRGQGALELSVVYILKKIDPNPIKSCPRL